MFSRKKKGDEKLRKVEVLFTEESYARLLDITNSDDAAIPDMILKGLRLYITLKHYQEEGRFLAVIGENGEVYAELIIPNVTAADFDKDPRRFWPEKIETKALPEESAKFYSRQQWQTETIVRYRETNRPLEKMQTHTV